MPNGSNPHSVFLPCFSALLSLTTFGNLVHESFSDLPLILCIASGRHPLIFSRTKSDWAACSISHGGMVCDGLSLALMFGSKFQFDGSDLSIELT